MSAWLLAWALVTASFADEQRKLPRVKAAAEKHDATLQQEFAQKGLTYPPPQLVIRVFKQEAELEVWAPRQGDKALALFRTIPICANSGGPGPKRRSGDGQVPEGVYEISAFNPFSSYHLALRVNYPNASDRKRGTAPLGGDIMIHGDCVTIGCVPLQGEIEWLYWLAAQTKGQGGKITAHMLPFRMDASGWQAAEARWPSSPHWPFWRELRPVFTNFEASHQLPHVRVGAGGAYMVD